MFVNFFIAFTDFYTIYINNTRTPGHSFGLYLYVYCHLSIALYVAECTPIPGSKYDLETSLTLI